MKDIHGGNIWGVSKKLHKRPGEILDFSASINPLGLSPKAAEGVRLSLSLAAPYPDPACVELKQALSAYYSVSALELLPANGSTQLIYLLPEVLRPERALIVEPAFSEYALALKLYGCACDGLALKESGGFALDLKRLAKRLGKARYDLVYIASPANPTGVATEKDALTEAAAICRSAGATLVVDEAFADFSPGTSITQDAPSLGNVVVLRSMTKFFSMAGLRLGFMVSGAPAIKTFASHMPPWSVNTLASAAALASLSDKAYLRATADWIGSERPYLFERLKKLPGLTPFASDANYFLVKIDAPSVTAPVLKARLLERGIMIRDLSSFRGLGERYFRVAVRKRAENRRLLDGLSAALKG